MKSKLIGLSILIVILLFAFSFLHKAGVKNVHNFSDSKYTSKKNNFYIRDYVPTEKVIKLKYWPATIVLDTAWTEYQWVEEANFLSSTLRKADNGAYNIGFKIKSESTEDFVYSLDIIPESVGSIGGNNPLTKQHEGVLYTFPDTLKIIVQEKNPVDSIGWTKHIVTDTITYIKLKIK